MPNLSISNEKERKGWKKTSIETREGPYYLLLRVEGWGLGEGRGFEQQRPQAGSLRRRDAGSLSEF